MKRNSLTISQARSTCTFKTLGILFLTSSLLVTQSRTQSSNGRNNPPLAVSYLDQLEYSQPGDINIGVLVTLTELKGNTCSNKLVAGSLALELSEVLPFVVKQVNDDPGLLPNVTLGFVVLNDCNNPNIAMARSLSFLPRVKDFNSTDGSRNIDYGTSAMPYYNVIGVVSPQVSQSTVMITGLLATTKIPVIGSSATSDSLSDKTLYPFFMRVAPPDKYQVAAMVNFIKDNKWNYISVVYITGSYGEKAFDNLKTATHDYGICIAASHRVDEKSNYNSIVKNLLSYPRARVVILFMYAVQAKNLFDNVRVLNATGHFIWLGSDGLGSIFRTSYKGYESDVMGMFTFRFYASVVPEYYQYLRSRDPANSTNPWLKPAWEQLANCSLANKTCDPNLNILESSAFSFLDVTSLYMDGALTLAHGAHDMRTNTCPGATGEALRDCIKGDLFLSYLKNVSFDSYNGHIYYDNLGDIKGLYQIRQVVMDYVDISFINKTSTLGPEHKLIAIYDTQRKTINYTSRAIRWDFYNAEEPVVPLREGEVRVVPESVCSRPCGVGEYVIQKELECCWECLRCRDNERIVRNGTGCQVCDVFTWPDEASNYTTCVDIALTYHSVTDTLPLIQLCVGVAAIVCAVLIVVCYVRYREVKVIKAASRELSILQMVAIFVGYLTVILFQTTPTPGTCGTLYFLFCLSFTWLYAPLLVKVIRIYRIFESGSKNNQRPRFISPQSQLTMTAILIAVQIIICLYIYAVYKPTSRKTQPIATEKFVELSCHMTLPGLTSFLVYNLVLIVLCSVFAFKTRKLPDNFNESRFISMCVSTTLIIWLAFITTYFTASRDFVRVLVLSVTLLLNHSVAIIFLYAPKIYAAVYLAPENFITTRFLTNDTNASGSNIPRKQNRVAPIPSSSTIESPKF
ncbi:metabotropic glutamate receptor 4-like [Physella acuta]|uniref:metabotropic glutamate receptor 4-like n=1 Tax=Physella acuta TaxID=109671 RepID=UPI0027DBAB18|nr:metabotropic glutamate receptor 4-like [Physella acuta]